MHDANADQVTDQDRRIVASEAHKIKTAYTALGRAIQSFDDVAYLAGISANGPRGGYDLSSVLIDQLNAMDETLDMLVEWASHPERWEQDACTVCNGTGVITQRYSGGGDGYGRTGQEQCPACS